MRKKTIDMIPVLTIRMKTILESFSKSRSLPASLVKRSRIILMASQGITNRIIAKELTLHYINVGTWRNRFLENMPLLGEVEAAAPEKLSNEIVRILSDERRPGPRPKFTQEQIMRIIDLACKSPSDFGYEVSHWSLPLLVEEIQKQHIADRISVYSVSRFLKMR